MFSMSTLLKAFGGLCLVTVFVVLGMYFSGTLTKQIAYLDVLCAGKRCSESDDNELILSENHPSHLRSLRRLRQSLSRKSTISLNSPELVDSSVQSDPQESVDSQELFESEESVDSQESFESVQSPKSMKSFQSLLLSQQSPKLSQVNRSNHLLDIELTPVDTDDPMCTKCLSNIDMQSYTRCGKRMRLKNKGKEGCRFIDGSKRAAVALASFPGSGNTWVRGLLEKATGICTGAIYCDGGILNAGMYGEGVRSGSVLVVKTHRRFPIWTAPDKPQNRKDRVLDPLYAGAILIIRNPYDAFIAEWTRRSSGHTGTARVGRFGDSKPWNDFIIERCRWWSVYFQGWVVNAEQPTHIVRFEDLKVDAVSEVKMMLDYLHFDYDAEELEKRLNQDYGRFHRKHTGQDFEHYTLEQRLYINKTIADTLDYLRNGWSSTLGVQDYLWYNNSSLTLSSV